MKEPQNTDFLLGGVLRESKIKIIDEKRTLEERKVSGIYSHYKQTMLKF